MALPVRDDEPTYKTAVYNLKVLSSVRIRSGPSTSTEEVGRLNKDELIVSSHVSGPAKALWYQHSRGWSLSSDSSATYLKITADNPTTSSVVAQPAKSTVGQKPIRDDAPDGSGETAIADAAYMPTTKNLAMFKTLYEKDTSNTVNDLNGIYGLPYRFMDEVDMPINLFQRNSGKGTGIKMGIEYTDRIASKMPLLTLSPGRAAFMAGFTVKEKKGFLAYAKDTASGKLVESNTSLKLDDILDHSGKYYSFEYNYKEYFQFVNGLCQAQAKFLNLHKNYTKYDWSTNISSSVRGFFSGNEYVCFYVEAENQITETFSNTSGESMLDTAANKMSDLSKELDQVLGVAGGVKIDALSAEAYTNGADMDGLYDKNLLNSIKTRLAGGGEVVLKGGELIFPEIWKESSYSKSYDVTIKLQSPDGDDESIYLNIFVPMMHLLGLMLPKQMGINGYRAPFLVRAHYRGIFNVEMGLITSMSIRKGADGAWNANGLPTEMEISLSIKDLYEILTMSNMYEGNDTIGKMFSSKNAGMMFVNNTPMMDFIATMAGVNINKPEFLRKIDMFLMTQTNTVTHFGRNVWLDLNQQGSNIFMKLFGQ